MRRASVAELQAQVARLCQQANHHLPADVLHALEEALKKEESPLGRDSLRLILENAAIASKANLPLCQDCGTAVVFLEVGYEVAFDGDPITALNNGVAQGYQEGYLRKSMVRCPFTGRINTTDNTPPVIHVEMVPGDRVRLIVMPKGAGAENMSQVFMLNPGAGEEAISRLVVEVVDRAGGKACPPLVIGLGIGGNLEMSAYLAKKALTRPLGVGNPDQEVGHLEEETLRAVNRLGIGPLGFGGTTTALAVQAEVAPCHMASLPLTVNLQCHSARRAEVVL